MAGPVGGVQQGQEAGRKGASVPVASLLEALNEGNERTEPETFEVASSVMRLCHDTPFIHSCFLPLGSGSYSHVTPLMLKSHTNPVQGINSVQSIQCMLVAIMLDMAIETLNHLSLRHLRCVADATPFSQRCHTKSTGAECLCTMCAHTCDYPLNRDTERTELGTFEMH